MKKITSILIFLCALQTAAMAQTVTIKIISLLDRKPIANTHFYLKQNADTLYKGQTNNSGVAVIDNLQQGRYNLMVDQTDAFLSHAEDIEVLDNAKKTIVVALQVNKLNVLGEVVVTDRVNRMNSTDATVAHVVTKKEIEALPIEGRDITKSLFRLPNVTLSTLSYNEAPNISINGLSGIYTNYLIDGMDNNERFLGNVKFNTPFGFTEKVTVLTNNYSVEWGNTSNGIVNLTTRSGSNKFSGEVFYLTRPGKLVDAKSAFAGVDLYGNPVKDGFQRQQLGVGLGGAIKKDKTFYYVNFEQTFDIKDNLLTSPLLGVNETVRGKNKFTYASGKIDHNWNADFKTALRVNVGSFDVDQQGGGLSGGILFPSAASTQKNRTYLLALQNTYTIAGKLKGETNYQKSYFNWNYRDNPNFGKPGANVQAPNGTTIASIGPINYVFDDNEHTNQIQQKFRYTTGKHTLLAGAEFTTSNFSLLAAGNSNGFYTVRLNQAQLDALKAKNLGGRLDIGDLPSDVQVINYLVDIDKSLFGTTQNVFNVYAEDNIAVSNKLNVSLGVRFDYDNLSKGGNTKGDWNNLAPRTSFNYKIDDNNIIRGGYGIFYDKIKYSVTSDNLQFSNNSANFKLQLRELQRLGILNPNADLDRITHPGNLKAFFDQGSAPRYLNGPTAEEASGNRALQSAANYRIKNPDGYQNPYSHQYTLGYQRRVNENLSFIVDLVHTRTNNLYRITNLNTASSYTLDPANPVVRTPAAANLTRPVPIKTVNGQFEATINGQSYRGIARDVFMTETKGRARYSAMNLVLQKDKGANDNIAYRVSYSLAKIMTDAEGINVRSTDANNWDIEYGPGDNDRTHVLNAFVSWFPAKNFSLTPAMLFQSGQPISRYADASKFGGITDLNGNGESAYANAGPADYQPGETRNNDRLPSATTFDFSTKYKLMIKGGSAIEFSADVYNVLNTENLSGYNVARSASNMIQLGAVSSNTFVKRSAAPPRQFQFGMRYIW